MLGLFLGKKEVEKFKKPYYSLRSVSANKVLDVNIDGENKDYLTIWKPNEGDNQLFTFKRGKNGQFLLKCKYKDLFLTVQHGNAGAKVAALPQSGFANQNFSIKESEPGSKKYLIYTYSGMVLDIAENKSNNGAIIIQWK